MTSLLAQQQRLNRCWTRGRTPCPGCFAILEAAKRDPDKMDPRTSITFHRQNKCSKKNEAGSEDRSPPAAEEEPVSKRLRTNPAARTEIYQVSPASAAHSRRATGVSTSVTRRRQGSSAPPLLPRRLVPNTLTSAQLPKFPWLDLDAEGSVGDTPLEFKRLAQVAVAEHLCCKSVRPINNSKVFSVANPCVKMMLRELKMDCGGLKRFTRFRRAVGTKRKVVSLGLWRL
eukprot:COSAG05_NODE_265_length_12666_cov_104.645739_3_plen_229_part_00